jgi:putative peptidoglycan lipid II flippase
MGAFSRLRDLFNGGAYSVKRASALLAVSAILSNVLGLGRNILFLRLVPKDQLDVYFAAFRVPDFLFNIFIFGAISSAFVPLVSELFANKKERVAHDLTDQLLSWITLAFGAAAVVLCFAMGPLLHLTAHGFTNGRMDEAVTVSRILLLQSVFFAWSFTVGGYLNSTKRFSSYALAPLVYNAAIIGGGLLYPRFGVNGMAWGVVLGSLLHFGIQFRELLTKTSYRPHFDFRITPELKEVIRVMIPRSLSQGVSQFEVIVYTSLASGLLIGSITVFNSMNDIQTMPIQIIGNAVAVAFFPSIAAAVGRDDWDAANELLAKVFRASLFILIPAVVFAFVVRAQIVRLYIGIGHSDWTLTTLAINTFVAFMFGIVPSVLTAFLSRVFYAVKNTRTPMLLSVLATAIGVTYAFLAVKMGGSVVHLAVADSIVAILQCAFYAIALKRHRFIKLGILKLLPTIWGYAFGALLVGSAAYASLYLTDWIYGDFGWLGTRTVMGLLMQLLIAMLVGGAVFTAYSKRKYPEDFAWIVTKSFSKARP